MGGYDIQFRVNLFLFMLFWAFAPPMSESSTLCIVLLRIAKVYILQYIFPNPRLNYPADIICFVFEVINICNKETFE